MLNFILLAVVLALRVIPYFYAGGLGVDRAYEALYMADQLVIVLLVMYIYKDVSWCKYLNKIIISLSLVVSFFYLINFAFYKEGVSVGNYIAGYLWVALEKLH